MSSEADTLQLIRTKLYPPCITADLAKLLPPSVIARALISKVGQIELDVILVLDDCRCIRETVLHDLLAELLRYQRRAMEVVLASRTDSPYTTARAFGPLSGAEKRRKQRCLNQ